MTREELFRAVGEVREDQVEAAETVKKQTHPWRKFGVLAACLALIFTITAAAPRIRGQMQWKAIVGSFQPSVIESENDGDGEEDSWYDLIIPFTPPKSDSGGAAAGGMDGCEYSHPADLHLRPDYSYGVEIGELAGPGNGDRMMSASACLAWLEPEEIFAQDTVIFRGTVQDLQYYQVEMEAHGMKTYYTRALVKVTDSIRGDLTEGETYSLLYMGAKGYMSTSISGALEELEVGSDAIFMPILTDRYTGWQEGESYFFYADLATLYLGEGMRYVFLDTEEGLKFERNVYQEIADAETLEEAAAYIRRMIRETAQPAEIPAVSQAEPSETREANPEQANPSYFPDGPSGAREMPGGAYIGE